MSMNTNNVTQTQIQTQNNAQQQQHVLPVYRHEFSKAVHQVLTDFADMHKYDDRHTYKEAWKVLNEGESMKELMTREYNMMCANGSQVNLGTFNKNMYTSLRYHYRYKFCARNRRGLTDNAVPQTGMQNNTTQTTTKTPVGVSKVVREKIKTFLETKYLDDKPSVLFQQFKDGNITLLSDAQTNASLCPEMWNAKLKKAFKNLHYLRGVKHKNALVATTVPPSQSESPTESVVA